MRNFLIGVDGSETALKAVRYVARLGRKYGPFGMHMVTVEPSVTGWRKLVANSEALEEHLRAEGWARLAEARAFLDEEDIDYFAYVEFGDVAEQIVAVADRLECDHIVLGTRGLGAINGLMIGSVAQRVVHLAALPVTLIK